MAEPLVIENGAQLVLHWDYYGQTGVNVLGLHAADSQVLDVATANALAGYVAARFGLTAMKAHFDAQVQLTGVGIRDLREAFQPEIAATTFTAIVGTGGGVGIIAPASVVVTYRTALAGRSFRGRSYFGGLSTADVDMQAGVITTGTRTDFVTCMEGLRTDIAGSFVDPGGLAVLSRPRPAEVGPPPVSAWPGAATPVIACVVRSLVVGTQRRRLPRRG